MAISKSRSPSPVSGHSRCCKPCPSSACLVLVLAVPLVLVGAYSACSGGGYRQQHGKNFGVGYSITHPNRNTPSQDAVSQPSLDRWAHSSTSTSSTRGIGWFSSLTNFWCNAIFRHTGDSSGDEAVLEGDAHWVSQTTGSHCSASPFLDVDTDMDTDALRLASTTRGGGGRGWWYPGQRARRRKNVERALRRAEAKRAAVSARGSSEPLPKGLMNQGNTCYLNSLLQTLYHTPGLREAVFEALSQGGDGATVSALASVFRQLDEGGRPGSTLSLTQAMGVDPRVQQDAQEFGRFLFMALEGDDFKRNAPSPDEKGDEEGGEEGRQRGLSGAIKALFSGRLVNYIECIDVDFSKEKEEEFYDLPLDIKGSGTLEKSLDRFVEAEVLSGENRWRAGEHGLQEARKGMRFLELPPVLQFHLKRFEYDPYQDDLAKIHDRFEFPTELDMSPWLQDVRSSPPHDADVDTDVDAATSASVDGHANAGGACAADDTAGGAYKLSAVVMHVGGPAAGHYYAYVRYKKPVPSASSSLPQAPPRSTVVPKTEEGVAAAAAVWVKLDDHRVTKVSEAEVLRDAFGGGGGVYRGPGAELQGLFGQGPSSGGGGTASAYMLQYIRDQEDERGPVMEERPTQASEQAQP